MVSNSNFEITNFTVDPTSQKITSIEVNGEQIEMGTPVTVEDNKTASINVSTYSSPVEITPTSGNDAMAKATVTLTNIPAGASTLYAYMDLDYNCVYTTSTDLETYYENNGRLYYTVGTTGTSGDEDRYITYVPNVEHQTNGWYYVDDSSGLAIKFNQSDRVYRRRQTSDIQL